MKPILTILEPEHFSKTAFQRLREHFRVYLGIPAEGYVVPDYQILWCRVRHLGGLIFESLCRVKAIACNCTDVSHLPLEECQRRGIEVLSLKGIDLDTVHATAEHTISLMLQALRHRCDRTSGRIGRELYSLDVGIIGYGRIGSMVDKALDGLGSDGDWWEPQHPYSLEAWLARGHDMIVVCASLNETSRGMVNAEFLSKLKPGCILVNTARDAIVDHQAILEWLDRDRQAVYAHDFSDEWTPRVREQVSIEDDEALELEWPHPRIIGTPHIGGWTIESLHKTEELLAERVIQWAKEHADTTSTVSSVG